ncbi:HAMP domain-containing histidine kinase [Limosilactobacillus sp. STM2_1]|uniref:histidine kinase n=1 Tax=Limosilactobacillus rudii TaxID=2759755 RepID=A0A7W3UK72_9LACO|nr:HAMP domain-containing sensor histidine kinase [Limosilactobacillus rudii]MBB1078390.1 HAMP domain-containing histidine kinase [Limosilactobacillus rudii]MBB1096520.1 HAMP domain-containing histidine kinase [Limosilactobacillus rudii]MCD7134283.1 HAMP domain-containing histidine kinase [Limosilactobacillus rudii]
MIQRFRYKFIALSTTALIFVILTIIGSISALTTYRTHQEVKNVLTILVKNDGQIPQRNIQVGNYQPQQFTRESLHQYRYFTVVTDNQGRVNEIQDDHITTVTSQDARAITRRILRHKEDNGRVYYHGVTYAYQWQKSQGEKTIVILDESILMTRSREVMNTGLMLGLVTLVLYTIVLVLYSRRAIRPIIQAEQRQKEFITNASHELKTPLTVIAANTEMQEILNGENEWTTSTKQQVSRLTKLINNLVSLARMQEQPTLTLVPVDISQVATRVATSFKSVVKTDDKQFNVQIEKELFVNGDENYLQELLNILLDNANKYCDPNGEVDFTVGRASHSKNVTIKVANSYAEGKDVDYNRFFNRFYRADESHTKGKKAGFGIGLSMAQYIVKMFNGKIAVKYTDGKLAFLVTLKESKQKV